jgi:hypothetical protein
MDFPNLMMLQLFIPGARVYSVTDTIPFHLQFSSSPCSLQNIITPPSCGDVIIRVALLRQVAVETRGQTTMQNTVLAEGKLSEIPPLVSSPCEPGDSIHLDWEGEVRCSNITSVGSFDAGNVMVKVGRLLEMLLYHELN